MTHVTQAGREQLADRPSLIGSASEGVDRILAAREARDRRYRFSLVLEVEVEAPDYTRACEMRNTLTDAYATGKLNTGAPLVQATSTPVEEVGA